MFVTDQPTPQFNLITPPSDGVQLVWFKRDLRLADHAPLAEAAKKGPVLALVMIESDYWLLPETSCRHYVFWSDSLRELQQSGLPMTVRVGDCVHTLEAIHQTIKIAHIWSHQETGNGWTYARDKAVQRWCKDNAVGWTQHQQFGVFRGPINRNGWAKRWEAVMAEPVARLPDTLTMVQLHSDEVPAPEHLNLVEEADPSAVAQRQCGGRSNGLALLQSFFTSGRAKTYQRAMASPLLAADACSRLSAHLAYGTLSMRQTVQDAYQARTNIKSDPSSMAMPVKALDAFIARLHWHCHFIQKLESEPELEWQDMHPAFRQARTAGMDHPHFEAFAHGQTGFPFVDACMRSLIATGWINFRMRAMLTAFASYHLWLDWRASGTRLAQLFIDYEPGIHWPQIQMQSGSTAINTPRLYNPVKQSHDQDPDGVFIKHWVPELTTLSGRALHEPWIMLPMEAQTLGFDIGKHYPKPIIDHQQAARQARARLTAIRATPGFYDHQRAIYEKHGSRKSSRHTPAQQRPWVKKSKKSTAQLSLDFDHGNGTS